MGSRIFKMLAGGSTGPLIGLWARETLMVVKNGSLFTQCKAHNAFDEALSR